ncbi:hypothetical protein [Vreelandella sp. EE22]
MKKLTATAAIALALVSGAAFAERGSAELNAIGQPESDAVHQTEGRNASLDQLIAKNSSTGQPISHADSSASNVLHNDTSLSQLQAKNGATGEQTLNATTDVPSQG